MTKFVRDIMILFFSLVLCTSCGTSAKLYKKGDKNKIYSGQLDALTYQSLQQALPVTPVLKDTIIIKYDYNNETCWSILDQSDDNHIQGFVTRHNERVQNVFMSRPNVSVFDFREPGNNLNKIKKWNTSIIIDSTKQLYNLLFKERAACGNSIIVLPDRRFVFIRSDSHSEALNLTQDKIIEYLESK